MAKNYTFSEAVAIIAKGTDLEAIIDIGRRYPALVHKVVVVATKAGDEFVDLMSYMPDYLTANKVNSAIKAEVAESSSDEDEATDSGEAEEPASNDADEGTEESAAWSEDMSAKQLWDVLGKAGKRKLAKSTKKVDLIEACKKAFGEPTKDESADIEDGSDESDEAANPYEGKSAMELFKECKARKIKAAPKHTAKYYVDLLIKDDEAKAGAENTEETSDDDWDDDKVSKADDKKEKKEKKVAAKKAAATKKEETKSDDDDDWDI